MRPIEPCNHRWGPRYTAWDPITGLAWVRACVQCPVGEVVEHIIRPSPPEPEPLPEFDYDDYL